MRRAGAPSLGELLTGGALRQARARVAVDGRVGEGVQWVGGGARVVNGADKAHGAGERGWVHHGHASGQIDVERGAGGHPALRSSDASARRVLTVRPVCWRALSLLPDVPAARRLRVAGVSAPGQEETLPAHPGRQRGLCSPSTRSPLRQRSRPRCPSPVSPARPASARLFRKRHLSPARRLGASHVPCFPGPLAAAWSRAGPQPMASSPSPSRMPARRPTASRPSGKCAPPVRDLRGVRSSKTYRQPQL